MVIGIGKIVYRGKRFAVERIHINHFGKKGIYDRIVSADSVCVVALHGRHILLEKQYRWVLGKHLYELPAGYVERREKPTSAARRELKEETGYAARNMKFLFKAYVSPGTKTELMSAYLATNLVKSKTDKDTDEIINIKEVSIAEALGMIKRNEIIDLKSIACVLFCAEFKLL